MILYLCRSKNKKPGNNNVMKNIILETARLQLRVNTLYSIIRDTNLASQQVALRNGMRVIDTIVKHYRGADMPHLVFCVKKRQAD